MKECPKCKYEGKPLGKEFPIWWCEKCKSVWRIDRRGSVNSLNTLILKRKI